MIGIVYIENTNENISNEDESSNKINYENDCGSFTLSEPAKKYYHQLFFKEFDKIDLSRNCDFPYFSLIRIDQRLVRIVTIFGDNTCIDCILGIRWVIPNMIKFFTITCNLKTDKTENIVFLENKYTLHCISCILYYDMPYDNIIKNLHKFIENKSGVVIYRYHRVSINVIQNIILSDETNETKIFKLKKIISYYIE
jgi:hypothetical protein